MKSPTSPHVAEIPVDKLIDIIDGTINEPRDRQPEHRLRLACQFIRDARFPQAGGLAVEAAVARAGRELKIPPDADWLVTTKEHLLGE